MRGLTIARAAVALAGLVLLAGGARAEPRVFELALHGGVLPEAQRVVRVRQGDDVTIRWTTDRPLSIHLHGYDLETRLEPGIAVEMRVRARAAGRFPIEVHAQGIERERALGYFEVHPR